MSVGLSVIERNTESSKITSEDVDAEIDEFFLDPWKGAETFFLDKEDDFLMGKYLRFVSDKKTYFKSELNRAGDDPEKLAEVRSLLRTFSISFRSLWAQELQKAIREEIAKEAKRSNDELTEMFAALSEGIDDDDKTSGISAGTSVLPLDCENPFEGLNLS